MLSSGLLLRPAEQMKIAEPDAQAHRDDKKHTETEPSQQWAQISRCVNGWHAADCDRLTAAAAKKNRKTDQREGNGDQHYAAPVKSWLEKRKAVLTL